MRPTAIFFGYLFACLALAAVLAVPLMQTGWIDYPPHRVMGRLAQVFILLGLWPMLRVTRLADRTSLGYGVPRPEFLRGVARGWELGVIVLLLLVAAELILEIRIPESDMPAARSIAARVVQALVAGLLIATLEETFFRGALFSAIRRRGGLVSAAAWSAMLYAMLHVMKPGVLPDAVLFDWATAWQMFAGVFVDTFQWRHLDTVLALSAVGVFLALVRERTGHIGWCIGLHAGWVFVIQVARRLTDANPDAAWALLAGDYDGIIGWLAAAWIGLLAVGYWRLGAGKR